MLDPRAFLINSKTGRVVAATFIEFLSGNSTNPSICFTDSPDSGLQCDNTGAVNYVKNGINLGELGTASSLIGGSDTQIQFNDSGSFGGSADLTWDDTGKELGVGGDINLDDGGTYETTVQVVTPTANRTISFPDATGTVALVAGSSGQVTYNNAGAQAGLTSASIGSTGEINISLAGAASTPPVSFTGSWFTGGTATTTKPQLLIEPTGTTSTAWSTSGTGLGVNAASGFSGRLLDLQTNGTSRMVVQGDGLVGIGTTSPLSILTAGTGSGTNAITINGANSSTSVNQLVFVGGGGGNPSAAIEYDATNPGLAFQVGNYSTLGTSERARIDSSGRLLVGTSTARTVESAPGTAGVPKLQVEGNDGSSSQVLITDTRLDGRNPSLAFAKTRNGASVAADDILGSVSFFGDDGTDTRSWGGRITCEVDGTPGANDMPGRLVFSTTADSASTPTERMRIDSAGRVMIPNGVSTAPETNSATDGITLGCTSGSYAQFAKIGGSVAGFNRMTDDGTIVRLMQAGTEEGTISVSGSTVSYNGAHLSRWSQLVGIDPYDKTARPEILRGTVMSNLDEMCDWTCPTSGDCQDNEQLNKTEISSVDDDPNVAGVFQSWDDEDDTWVNDYYLAMTGDFVIRIAAGTTVQRGDLLCSAGDGTARPQGDRYIKDSTIAKVTSTTVAHTHPDGSYCVPCVLMAC